MLRLFGPPRLDADGRGGLPNLAFLAAAIVDLRPAASIPRATLAGLLWGDVPSSRANANLRQMLSLVRGWETEHGGALFVVDDATVSRPVGTVETDLRSFLQIGSAPTPDALDEVNGLYSGELLEGVTASSPDLDLWLGEQRDKLREQFLRIATDGAQRLGGDTSAAVLTRLEREEPLDERVVRARMISSRGNGVQEVRRVYDSFAASLKAELQAEPEHATRTLFAELTSAAPPTAAEPAGLVSVGTRSVPKLLILPPMSGGSRGISILANALIDDVTHSLGRSRLFAVFAPHTARQLAVSPFPTANPYGADYLVTTSIVERDAARLRFMLTRLETHELLVSDELPLEGPHVGRGVNLAEAIAGRLSRGVTQAEMVDYRRTGSASALVHYLLGVDYLNVFSLQSVRRARAHLQRALKLSKDYSPARAALARSLCLEWLLLDRKDSELIEHSLELAQRAAEDDPTDPMAHRELGHALIYLDRVEDAVENFETGVALGPHIADVLFHYADGLGHLGKFREARTAMDRALSLNPIAPDLYHWVSATTDYFLGKYASAAASLARLKDQEPAARVIALVEAMNGNIEKAHRYRDIFLASHPDFRLADYHMPQRSAVDREHYLEGLRRAGFH